MTAFKMFIDGNFDEDSKILDEPKSTFDNIDIELEIKNANSSQPNKAVATMEMFEMPKEFASCFDKIVGKLPGFSAPIHIASSKEIKKSTKNTTTTRSLKKVNNSKKI